MLLLQTRYGPICALEVETDLITRCLAHYGEWAWMEAQFIASVIPEGARVLDIGAFLGTFTLGLEKLKKISFACAVEPNSALTQSLSQNMRVNGPGNFRVIDALVGTTGTPLQSGRADAGNLGSNSYSPHAAGDIATGLPSQMVTLPELRHGNGPFDLIKIDAEGMEQEILRSDAAYLVGGKTALWVECNENPASLDLCELFFDWGLEVYYFAFPFYNQHNFLAQTDVLLPMAFEAGLLIAPRKAPSLTKQQKKDHCILRKIDCTEDLKRALWQTPRWGFADWDLNKISSVVASAGHALLGDTYETYLSPNWTPGIPWYLRVENMAHEVHSRTEQIIQLEQKLHATEHALAVSLERQSDLKSSLDGVQNTNAAMAYENANAQILLGALQDKLAALNICSEACIQNGAHASTTDYEESGQRILAHNTGTPDVKLDSPLL